MTKLHRWEGKYMYIAVLRDIQFIFRITALWGWSISVDVETSRYKPDVASYKATISLAVSASLHWVYRVWACLVTGFTSPLHQVLHYPLGICKQDTFSSFNCSHFPKDLVSQLFLSSQKILQYLWNGHRPTMSCIDVAVLDVTHAQYYNICTTFTHTQASTCC